MRKPDAEKTLANYLGTITKRTARALRLSEVAELAEKCSTIATRGDYRLRYAESRWWDRKRAMLDGEYLRRLDSALLGKREFDMVRLENKPGSSYRYRVETTEPGNVRALGWGGEWPASPAESPQDAKKEAA